MRTKLLQTFALGVAFGMVSCSGSDVVMPPAVGGAISVGGSSTSDAGGTAAGGNTGASIGGIAATGGSSSGNNATGGAATGGAATGGAATGGARTGGAPGNGGTPATGGTPGTGGAKTGGAPGNGGTPATGGTLATNTGGMPGTGGAKTGGAPGIGGAATGGTKATGGAATGGTKATGGAATGGATGVAGATSTVDCSTPMPTGGTVHTGNTQGGTGSLAWSLWSNGSGGSITTFSTPAFSTSWSNSGDFLARMGLEWGSSGKTYDQYGTITAQYAFTKTGSGGGYSYIGIYGWSTNPCIEYYIVENSYGAMPFTPYNSSQKGSAVMIDGENYKFFSNSTTGTGGNRCGNVTSWNQFWSVRQTARTCGTITINKHFDGWKAAGMTLGNMLEAKILVEVGGGTGSVSFPVANVTAQ